MRRSNSFLAQTGLEPRAPGGGACRWWPVQVRTPAQPEAVTAETTQIIVEIIMGTADDNKNGGGILGT